MHQKLRRLLAAAVPEGVERLAVRDRDEWLRWRRASVTASVAGALLGTHEYTSRYQLHMLKAGLVEDATEETPAMRRGRLLEPVAVQFLREEQGRLGWLVDPCGYFYTAPARGMGATPDTVAWRPDVKGLGTIQIKTVAAAAYRAKWAQEDGTVRPPDWIVVQAIQEAYMIGASWACVAPMVIHDGGDIELPCIDVPLHAGVWARLVEETSRFWQDVEDGVPPDPDFALDGDMIERAFDPRTLSVDLGADNELPALLDEREACGAARRDAEGRLKEIRAELMFKLDRAARDAEGGGERPEPVDPDAPVVGTAADGRRVVASTRARAEFVSKATSWRQLDVKAPAKGWAR